jgi:hypothetical protein
MYRMAYAAGNAVILSILYSVPTSMLFNKRGETDRVVEGWLWLSVVRYGGGAGNALLPCGPHRWRWLKTPAQRQTNAPMCGPTAILALQITSWICYVLLQGSAPGYITPRGERVGVGNTKMKLAPRRLPRLQPGER